MVGRLPTIWQPFFGMTNLILRIGNTVNHIKHKIVYMWQEIRIRYIRSTHCDLTVDVHANRFIVVLPT